jgi:hypothetical protein
MKLSSLIAIAAAGVLSASASACPVTGAGNSTHGTSQQPVRTLLHSTAASTCTPRQYWLPAQCTPDRSVTSASQAGHSHTSHTKTGTETCTPPIDFLPARCQ